MWSAWNNSNTSLQQRVTESTEAHNKLQSHHSKTMQEIYDQASTWCFMADYNIFTSFRIDLRDQNRKQELSGNFNEKNWKHSYYVLIKHSAALG